MRVHLPEAPSISSSPRVLWVPDGARRDMLREADRSAPNETGGVLLGYWSTSGDAAVVEQILGPGPKAVHRRTTFIPDDSFHYHEIARLYHARSDALSYLGDWHTHPNGTAYLSATDKSTLHRIARYEAARAPRPVMLIAAGGQPWRLAAWVGEPRQGWWLRRLQIEPMTLCTG